MHGTRFSWSLDLLALTACIATGALVTGCRGGVKTTEPIRAIWVTRFDYLTADDVTRITEDCHNAGFNTVLFQVRGNGTVFYRSKIEPWAEQFDFEDPGFDPLRTALDEARRRGMQLHAWVNVMPAWRGTTPPAHPDHLYHRHPEWFWYDQQGERQALNWFYVSLNPCLPEVRGYLVELFRELVTNYDVDGLHLDYIRFPNEPPAVPEGSNIDYPYDQRTLAFYKEETGLTPAQERESWNQWRTGQVTRLVADIRAMMRRAKPRAVLSAAVGTDRQRSLEHFRDGKRWTEEGLVDLVFPMNYKPSLKEFDEGLAMWLPGEGDVRVVPGVWFDRRLPVEEGIPVVRAQIEAALAKTGGFCLFGYGSLFESRDRQMAHMMDEAELAKREEEHKRAREIRRRELLPFLRSLAVSAPER